MYIDIEKFKEWIKEQKEQSQHTIDQAKQFEYFHRCVRESGIIDAYDFILEQIEENYNEHEWIINKYDAIDYKLIKRAFTTVANVLKAHVDGQEICDEDWGNIVRMTHCSLYGVQ